jgi:hypothetical protein
MLVEVSSCKILINNVVEKDTKRYAARIASFLSDKCNSLIHSSARTSTVLIDYYSTTIKRSVAEKTDISLNFISIGF